MATLIRDIDLQVTGKVSDHDKTYMYRLCRLTWDNVGQ